MNDRFIGPFFVLAILSALAFCAVYWTGGDAQWEGLSLGVALLSFGAGIILWAKHFFDQTEVVSERHTVESPPEEVEEFTNSVKKGGETVTRRKFLASLGAGAVGALGLAAIFPLRSLGPAPDEHLWKTKWQRGKRLVRDTGEPVRPDTLEVGGVITVWPEGEKKHEESATLLIRVPEKDFRAREGREDWIVEGNVAYSKICTHVGCPVGLYQESTHELLCPCHQSTFNVLDGARPTFGPATRSLPQLPLGLNAEGFLIARSDYQEPVGATFWNRDRRKHYTGGEA